MTDLFTCLNRVVRALCVFSLVAMYGCSGAKPIASSFESPAANGVSETKKAQGESSLPRLVLKLATVQQVAGVKLTATPNPAAYGPDGTYPVVSLRWNVPNSTTIEIHMKSADGVLFASGGSFGTATTGPWVQPGALFYLQDVSRGEPGTTEAILKASICKGCKA